MKWGRRRGVYGNAVVLVMHDAEMVESELVTGMRLRMHGYSR